MNRELVDARRHFRKLAIRLKILDMRRSARWIFDRFHFGNGIVERLLASFVFSALFFLALLGIAAAVGLPAGTGLAMGCLALGTAVAVSAFLVLGPADEELAPRRAELLDKLDADAVRLAEIEKEEAVRQAEEADRRAQEKAEDADRRAKESDRRSQRRADKEDRLARAEEARKRTCRFCGGRIKPWAMKCPNCHEYLDEDLARKRRDANRPRPNTGLAAVLSFLIPGLGQIYKGQVLSGLIWMMLVEGTFIISILGTAFCCVGFVGLPFAILFHLCCIFDAASGGR